MKIITIICLFLSLTSYAQWSPTNGPFGGSPYCLLYKNSSLFAGTDCGVFVSSNDGEVWERRANGLTDCTPVVALVEFNNNILAGTNNGVYLSSDNGLNWNSSSSGLTNLNVFCFYVNGQDILLSTQGGVFKSTNGGNSWSLSSIGIPGNSGAVTSITKLGNSLFATHMLGVFKSNDNGFSWSLTNSGLSQGTGGTYSVGTVCAVNTTLFVTTNDGLYLSINNGTSWTQSTSNLPLNCSNLYYSGTSLYVNAGTGIYKSTTNGNTWNQIGTLYASRFLYANNKLYTTYIGTSQDESNGVYKAINNESVWSNIGLGRAGSASDILKDGNNLYCATNNGFYFSNDQGNTWRLRNNGLNINTAVNCISKHGSNLFIGTNKYGVFKSSDLGLNWVQVVNGLYEAPIFTFHRIMSIESIGTDLYIGALSLTTNQNSAPQGRIFKSSNNGTSWTNTTNNINNGDNFVYVYDIHTIGSVIYLATNEGVFLSTNSGGSWVGSNSGMPTNQILALSSNATSLFAAHYDATSSTQSPFGGVFVSQDYGSNWGNNNYWSNETVYSLFSINNIVFGGSRYPLISNDNGNTWTSSGNGLPVAPINAFHGDNNGVYAAMSYGNGYDAARGVYKYNGVVGINESLLSNSDIIYPNPFTNYIEIKNSFLSEGLKYEIIDCSSRVVKNGNLVNNRIEHLENLINGIYYLKFIDNDKISLYKIIK
jgi:ligand-binding sensor domain-containing protein